MRKLFKICMAFIAGLMMGTLLLSLVYLLPTEPMRKNMGESISVLTREGENPFILPGHKGSSLDNYTDAIMLGNAVYRSERPFYQAAMLTERAVNEQDKPIAALADYVADGKERMTEEYFRYWHGYLVVLKPLLLFLNYRQIRVLNGIAFLLVLAVTAAGFLRVRMRRGGVALILAVMGLFPMAIPFSLQFSSAFYIGMLSVAAVLYQGDLIEKKELWGIFFLIVGMCTSYLDFLTYPLFTFGMPLIVCIVRRKQRLLESVRNGICWGSGYFGMWAGKWTIGSLLTGRNLWIDAMESAGFRLSGGAYEERISRIMGVLRNFYIYVSVWGLLLALAVVLWNVLEVRQYREKLDKENGGGLLLLLAAACLPIVWYLVMANHSYIHYWYTFRILAVSIFAVAMIPEYLYQNRLMNTVEER